MLWQYLVLRSYEITSVRFFSAAAGKSTKPYCETSFFAISYYAFLFLRPYINAQTATEQYPYCTGTRIRGCETGGSWPFGGEGEPELPASAILTFDPGMTGNDHHITF